MKKRIVSLFDYTGNWSRPYAEAGYEVILFDIKHPKGETTRDNVTLVGGDIMRLPPGFIKRYSPCYGVLAAPPCTDFSSSGAWMWPRKDADGTTEASLRLIDKTLAVINALDPSEFWVLENPVGRLRKLRPVIGDPWYFQPFHYGDAHHKKTGLYGQFNRELERSDVEPVVMEAGLRRGSPLWFMGGHNEEKKTIRATTPMGFSRAFFSANQ